jgi:hypothetical protein
MATRDELLAVVAARYRSGTRTEKTRIADEFAAVTGFHRKHVLRLLRTGPTDRRAASRPARRIYDEAVRDALIVLWEASDRICGKRLKALIPTLVPAMERHGHLALAPEIRASLLTVSAATIDRTLRPQRERSGVRRQRRGPPSSIRRSIPVRTFSDWNDPPPGFVEADLVAHSGPIAAGSFVQTLVLTDIATGWTECAPLLVREQTLLVSVLTRMRGVMPFPLLGLDVDNDTVFMNESVRDYCRDEGIVLTRCRPYRKNDQAHIEQKNGAIVRRIVGYRRFEGMEAARMLAGLYATTRLFVNAFQPSFKLAEKERDGARVRKRYHAPATPCDRMRTDPRTSPEVRDRVEALCADLDPVRLLADMRTHQRALVEIADRIGPSVDAPAAAQLGPVPIAAFLAGLRTAWQLGEVRPTAQAKPSLKRWRRRADPLITVTDEMRAWFEADPSQTGCDLLLRLQTTYPGHYRDGLLRTVQRRLQVWRSEMASSLVFGDQAPAVSSAPPHREHAHDATSSLLGNNSG